MQQTIVIYIFSLEINLSFCTTVPGNNKCRNILHGNKYYLNLKLFILKWQNK